VWHSLDKRRPCVFIYGKTGDDRSIKNCGDLSVVREIEVTVERPPAFAGIWILVTETLVNQEKRSLHPDANHHICILICFNIESTF
jgi:hypothetical protein